MERELGVTLGHRQRLPCRRDLRLPTGDVCGRVLADLEETLGDLELVLVLVDHRLPDLHPLGQCDGVVERPRHIESEVVDGRPAVEVGDVAVELGDVPRPPRAQTGEEVLAEVDARRPVLLRANDE